MNIKSEYNGKKITLYRTETTRSTNLDAKAVGKDGALIVADRQTGGKGRMGRDFVSEKGGVYMSLFLDIGENAADTLFLTSAAAVAVSRALDTMTNESTLIKWVNDIYLRGKKVCGILAEGVIQAGRMKSAVLGVGVNLVGLYSMPPELENKAGFVFESGDFEALREKFINLFLFNFTALFSGGKKEEIYTEYQKKNYLSGKTVRFSENGKMLEGKVKGIAPDISLVVLSESREYRLRFGEAEIKL